MEPRQNIGKSDAARHGPDYAGPPNAQRSDHDPERGIVPHSLIWGVVAAAVVAGLPLYFVFERDIAPLIAPVFGGGH